jgi:ABC-type Fe3+-hydroxamate transport system substrate-binding protein
MFKEIHMKTKQLFCLSMLVVFLLLTACQPIAAPAVPAAETITSSSSGYPLTIDSCGEPMTFVQAPQRMVVFENNLLEIALRLGLQDRIVGIWTGSELSVDPTVQAAAEQLTAISGTGRRAGFCLERLGLWFFRRVGVDTGPPAGIEH